MTRNIVVEVEADTRKLVLQRKIKMGWQICRIDDYLVANRCFKCSRFNHRHRDSRGEVTCPLCAGPHTLKECKSESKAYKCINCVIYNKHNPNKNISIDQSSQDKRCPSMQATIEKYRLNRNTKWRAVKIPMFSRNQIGKNERTAKLQTFQFTAHHVSYRQFT